MMPWPKNENSWSFANNNSSEKVELSEKISELAVQILNDKDFMKSESFARVLRIEQLCSDFIYSQSDKINVRNRKKQKKHRSFNIYAEYWGLIDDARDGLASFLGVGRELNLIDDLGKSQKYHKDIFDQKQNEVRVTISLLLYVQSLALMLGYPDSLKKQLETEFSI